jgi:hypothetical protein
MKINLMLYGHHESLKAIHLNNQFEPFGNEFYLPHYLKMYS